MIISPDSRDGASEFTASQSATRSPTGGHVALITIGAYSMLRVIVLLFATTPSVVPDEPGYWAVARWLAGARPLIHMHDMPVYQFVHGAILAPLYWLPMGATSRYRVGLTVGFMMVFATGLVVRQVVRHLGGNALEATTAFAVTLLYPATLATTSFTWSESTVLLWVVLFIAGLAELTCYKERPRAFVVIAVSVLAGLAPFVHGRLAALPVVWLGVLVCCGLQHRRETNRGIRLPLVAVASAITLAVAGAALSVQHLAIEAVWTEGLVASEHVRTVLLSPSQWTNVASAAGGQLWYATVSSAGLAVVGVIALAGLTRRRNPAGQRLFAAGVLVGIAGVVTISSVFMATAVGRATTQPLGHLSDIRWDYTYYGRYIDPVVLVAAVAGVMALLRLKPTIARSRFSVAAATAMVLGAGLAVRWSGVTLAPSVALNVAGIAAMHVGTGRIPVLAVTAVALAGMGLLTWGVGKGPVTVSRLTVAMMLVGSLGATTLVVDFHRTVGYDPLYREVPEPIAARPHVVIAADAAQDRTLLLNWYGQQYVLTDLGWNFEFSDQDSAELAKSPAPDTGLLALSGRRRPAGPEGSWKDVGGGGGVRLWLRRAD